MRRQALVPFVTYPEAVTDAVTINAVAMAAKLDADLHALAVNVDIPPVSNALSRFLLNTPELIRQAEIKSGKRGMEMLTAVAKQAKQFDMDVTTKTLVAAPALLGDVAAKQARYFDFALVGWEANNATSQMTAEAVIFGSGRPTILLPELSTIGALDHIAIAWDGSRVAARAVADSRLLLERATRISVLTVVDEKPLDEGEMGERLAEGLRKRGLPAEAVAIRTADCPIGVTLQDHAIESGAALLVMGGYGHSRIRDFVLGGATEGILNDLRLPVLLSH
ncbi:universal stress protein [Mesorhizobium sp. YR577]|uniref:universal stress protein n=1 Tax=Mesorhizobium sp. YR577 TaxID=1884373 RepID=UPI0008EC474B|nr:universal stress protein [Mesorhizobium sp. YR577]SFU21391.1 Universal stress protein family protein [Mesorhizobium sp. YR577]